MAPRPIARKSRRSELLVRDAGSRVQYTLSTMTALSISPTWIGMAAALLTTAAFAPQAIQAWRTRSTRDISLPMFTMMVAGIALWLTYGILISDVPLIVANAVTLVLAGSILVAKIRFR